MARPKKVEEPEEELESGNNFPDVVTPAEPVGPHSKKARELKVKVKAASSFIDGNLMGFFAALGFDGNWPKDEVREIPKWLFDRCVQSGAELIEP